MLSTIFKSPARRRVAVACRPGVRPGHGGGAGWPRPPARERRGGPRRPVARGPGRPSGAGDPRRGPGVEPVGEPPVGGRGGPAGRRRPGRPARPLSRWPRRPGTRGGPYRAGGAAPGMRGRGGHRHRYGSGRVRGREDRYADARFGRHPERLRQVFGPRERSRKT